MPSIKKDVMQALLGADFALIAELAKQHKRVFSILISVTFDKESLIAWRAIEAMGVAVGAVADESPAKARDIIRRLLWSVTEESGSIGWSAPEMLAEAVVNRPGQFLDLPPIILSLSDEPPFLRGVLWAMGRLAEAGLGTPHKTRPLVLECLSHPDPAVRGLAVWAAGQMKISAADPVAAALARDQACFSLYRGGKLVSVRIGDLASSFSHGLQVK